ncbi:MAG: site-specific DNA-methyltransferase, partial [Candidatus Lokiarchaeota archaeon]|nr:site-specific DNA-methyltransferase [Candidatus Lokiarchaeota archaeon]
EIREHSDKKFIDLGERGRYCVYNKLNDLTGKEWIKFTKSWFILRPKKRDDDVILHPAKFPESLIKKFILFFTKKGEKVLDPMAGTGTVNYVCEKLGRIGYAVELEEKYYYIGKKRAEQNFFLGDCRNFRDFDIPIVDYIITSPPYWDSLKRNSMRQKERKEEGLDTEYSSNRKNFENIQKYENFLEELVKFYVDLKNLLKNKGYMTLFVNNIYKNSQLYPLAFDLASKLRKHYVLKDEKIWCQDDKPLIPLGVNSAYVGNRHHIYCIILRNEK